VGWFTSLYPVRLDVGDADLDPVRAGGPDAGAVVKRVKEQLRAIPGNGAGFGLLRYLNPRTGPVLAALGAPQIGFNYLGRFGADGDGSWGLAPEAALAGGDDTLSQRDHTGEELARAVEITAAALDPGPVLQATWLWAGELFGEDDIADLARAWFEALRGIVAHVRHGGGGRTPSDLPLVELTEDDIADLDL
jgi:non-ribosomal peptide synthase protein (TIGR01720 family)